LEAEHVVSQKRTDDGWSFAHQSGFRPTHHGERQQRDSGEAPDRNTHTRELFAKQHARQEFWSRNQPKTGDSLKKRSSD
jgi:hypothetical protein